MLTISKQLRHLTRISPSVSRSKYTVHNISRQYRQQQAELAAVIRLVDRSLPTLSYNILQCRKIHTTTSLSNADKKNEDDREKEKKSSGNDKEQKNDKDKKKGKEEDDTIEKVLSVFTKAVLWTGLGYSIFWIGLTLSQLIWPNTRNVEDTERSLFVSWQEFVYEMLSAGEVREIIVRPELNMVTILLYDGAIVKGRRAHSKRYHIMVNNCLQFEDRLRQVEEKLGISESELCCIDLCYGYYT